MLARAASGTGACARKRGDLKVAEAAT